MTVRMLRRALCSSGMDLRILRHCDCSASNSQGHYSYAGLARGTSLPAHIDVYSGITSRTAPSVTSEPDT